jgi:hypothetical protein
VRTLLCALTLAACGDHVPSADERPAPGITISGTAEVGVTGRACGGPLNLFLCSKAID